MNTHSAQDFVAMPFDSTENRDAHVGYNIPETQSVIFACGQQQIRVCRMKLHFVYGVSVSRAMLDAGLNGRTENSDNASRSGHG
jgi:hypothetical protein